MGTHTEPVSRGIALLDHVKPGWRALVDLDRLDMCSTEDCVLAHVYGDYQRGIEVMTYSLDGSKFRPEAHGFDVTCHSEPCNGEHDWGGLRSEWRRQLASSPGGSRPE